MKTSLCWLTAVMMVAGLELGTAWGEEKKAGQREPELTIPFCKTPPKIDGKLEKGEWQYAAVVSMFEMFNIRVLRAEQPRFYVFRDNENLYVAMQSFDSNTDSVVAKTVMHDVIGICGDDCLELQVAPGAGKDLKNPDFPTFYWVVNYLGTLWDCEFVPLRNEEHNSWESAAEIANTTDGTYWACEMKIPLVSIRTNPPKDGEVWRMNFVRTYYGYNYSMWNASGSPNDARFGGNATFSSQAPAVRLMSCKDLVAGKNKMTLQIANGTSKDQKVKALFSTIGAAQAGALEEKIGQDEKDVEVKAGEMKEFEVGNGEPLKPFNKVSFEVKGEDGKRLYFVERNVRIPAPTLEKKKAPNVPLVNIFPRFLPSLERLAVLVDYTALVKKTNYVGASPKAEIKVFKKGDEAGKPVLEGALTEFKTNRGTWRASTKELTEGNYMVKVKVTAPNGDVLSDYDDWFEKKIFDWMKSPRGVGEAVPHPYTDLRVKDNEVKPWGRRYRFGKDGTLESVVSQGEEWLSGRMELVGQVDGKPEAVKIVKPFEFTSTKAAEVKGKTELAIGSLKLEFEIITEYDGFILYRLTYKPEKEKVTVNRLRVKLPITSRLARLYSAAGDRNGSNIQADVLSLKEGKVYDSFHDTRSSSCSPTFATLFWVADNDTCFNYAADSDKGWVIRDDAPAVEAYREGESLNLWLNLVDREFTLTGTRTLEFSFQAGPTKPLPDGWRGLQYGSDEVNSVNPDDAPTTKVMIGGSGDPMRGGMNFLHPGMTPELRKKSKEHIEEVMGKVAGERTAVVGYHFWSHVPKGMAETRVFRGEWGIDKEEWDSRTSPAKWAWDKRLFGENPDVYIDVPVNGVPSYVDYTVYAYDECLKETVLAGFYDDTGYPKPVYDEELGLGFVREDGRKICSSGLWIYRERMKRAAYVQFQNKRPNYIQDSQRAYGHYLPCYGWCGVWAPCERGSENASDDRDVVDMYGSMERYVAFHPSRQFGQIPVIGINDVIDGIRCNNAKIFVDDTRGMLMLTYLNDQDVGFLRPRDKRIVCGVRHAKHLIRPWEKEVEFKGYWQNRDWVKKDNENVLVSFYQRPGQVMFFIGNMGANTATSTIEPDWKKLKIDIGKVNAFNPETGDVIPMNAGQSGQGIRLEIPKHDIRLVYVTAPDGCVVEKTSSEALKPKEMLTEYSDDFKGKELASVWQKDLHEGNSGVWMLDGRLCVQGNRWGFAHVRRELGVDNVSVQCLIMSEWGGSLYLVWPNGNYATAGLSEKKLTYNMTGIGSGKGPEMGKPSIPGWYPYSPSWVKIGLKSDVVRFYSSTDGKTWKMDWEGKRGDKFAGAPQFMMLGYGQPGEKPHLDNVHKAFNPDAVRGRGIGEVFFSDLIVGRER